MHAYVYKFVRLKLSEESAKNYKRIILFGTSPELIVIFLPFFLSKSKVSGRISTFTFQLECHLMRLVYCHTNKKRS